MFDRSIERRFPVPIRDLPTHQPLFTVSRAIPTKLPCTSSRLPRQMKTERESLLSSDMNSMDRRVIRVDMPPTHAGIAAALRRAFEAAAQEPTDRDFADLLRKLN